MIINSFNHVAWEIPVDIIIIAIEFSRFRIVHLLLRKKMHLALPGILIPNGYIQLYEKVFSDVNI